MDNNAANEGLLSGAASRIEVRVIHTGEEQMIARSACRALGLGMASKTGNPDHVTRYISRLDPFAARGPPIVHSRGVPCSKGPPAPAGANRSAGTYADHGETDFSDTLSAGRQQRTQSKNR